MEPWTWLGEFESQSDNFILMCLLILCYHNYFASFLTAEEPRRYTVPETIGLLLLDKSWEVETSYTRSNFEAKPFVRSFLDNREKTDGRASRAFLILAAIGDGSDAIKQCERLKSIAKNFHRKDNVKPEKFDTTQAVYTILLLGIMGNRDIPEAKHLLIDMFSDPFWEENPIPLFPDKEIDYRLSKLAFKERIMLSIAKFDQEMALQFSQEIDKKRTLLPEKWRKPIHTIEIAIKQITLAGKANYSKFSERNTMSPLTLDTEFNKISDEELKSIGYEKDTTKAKD